MIWQIANERIKPAIWEIYPARGKPALLFGKNLKLLS
jgi:hypothetical protein